jgi:phosphoadenosine phosphosulfate reductase
MIANSVVNYTEQILDDKFILKIESPKTNWKEWIKTIGELKQLDHTKYVIKTHKEEFAFSIETTSDECMIYFDSRNAKQYPAFFKLFKQVFKKAASCIKCGECVANCCFGCITMANENFKIENCNGCHECHNINNGCLVYDSTNTRMEGVNGMGSSKSIDRYASHGPQKEWMAEFFNKESYFFEDNGLGSKMIQYFRVFLRDAELISDNRFSYFAKVIKKLGHETESGLGLILVNLAYTPQVGCYIQNIARGETLTRNEFIEFLCRFGLSENSAPKTTLGFERLLNLFNSVGLGDVVKNGNRIESFTRSYWEIPDSTVILYALYRFAEACEGYYQFSLDRLMDFDIESKGISPAQIFGLNEQTLSGILNGLSANHPEFIAYSETLGLQTINLRKDKTAKSVLELF